jgi:hypothetical protein
MFSLGILSEKGLHRSPKTTWVSFKNFSNRVGDRHGDDLCFFVMDRQTSFKKRLNPS